MPELENIVNAIGALEGAKQITYAERRANGIDHDSVMRAQNLISAGSENVRLSDQEERYLAAVDLRDEAQATANEYDTQESYDMVRGDANLDADKDLLYTAEILAKHGVEDDAHEDVKRAANASKAIFKIKAAAAQGNFDLVREAVMETLESDVKKLRYSASEAKDGAAAVYGGALNDVIAAQQEIVKEVYDNEDANLKAVVESRIAAAGEGAYLDAATSVLKYKNME